ncbi:MAG: saccharopine dehydrogenase NADP-binding domain-containing protein [Actinobacteria bacterium]|nr:saccharopine dehydrogenase NADP-binding domain-containing protein [Actinomycetota bacterium]
MTTSRSFDITLLGATGFTGGLAAHYLASNAPQEAKLALAGRTRSKLEAVAASLSREVAIMVVDTTDEASVRTMAESSRVVMTTVGPYILHGEPVVRACAESGTDYVDLTGEPEFVDLMYVKYNERAVNSGARIIHACGFDSIPHDLGVQFTVEQLPEGVPLAVRGYVTMKGTFSGGTAASALEAMSRMSESKKAHAARVAAEPVPAGRSAKVIVGRPGKSRDTGQWALPMPTVDPEIVLNSSYRLDRYGPDFSYSHYLNSKSMVGTASMLAGIGLIAGLAQVGPVRRWMGKRVPPGTGPSAEKRASSWFKVRFFGEGGGVRVVTEVAGADPGYGETAKMIGESALCLAFDDLPRTSGQQTTASAMGSALQTRLHAKGVVFTVITSA